MLHCNQHLGRASYQHQLLRTYPSILSLGSLSLGSSGAWTQSNQSMEHRLFTSNFCISDYKLKQVKGSLDNNSQYTMYFIHIFTWALWTYRYTLQSWPLNNSMRLYSLITNFQSYFFYGSPSNPKSHDESIMSIAIEYLTRAKIHKEFTCTYRSQGKNYT